MSDQSLLGTTDGGKTLTVLFQASGPKPPSRIPPQKGPPAQQLGTIKPAIGGGAGVNAYGTDNSTEFRLKL